MKRITKWWDRTKQSHFWENRWICKWILLVVVFTVVVHTLFSFTGPEWLQAKWDAGDLLSYVGTVSLGLLAVWQNKRFKEENDKAQERLEKLSQQSNELVVISKILEREERRIENVKETLRQFDDISNVTNIVGKAQEARAKGTLLQDMVKLRDELKIILSVLLEQLFNDPFTSTSELRKNVSIIFYRVDILAEQLMRIDKHIDEKMLEESCGKLKESKLEFISLELNYIQSIVKIFDHLLYDNVSLAEIKELRERKVKQVSGE